MKSILVLFISLLSLSANAVTYIGTVERAVGSAHQLDGQPCQIDLYEKTENHAIFYLSAGSKGEVHEIRKATRDGLIGIENLTKDLAYTSPEIQIAGTRLVQQDRLVLDLQTEGQIRIKASKNEWVPHSFYSSTLYSFVCVANRQ